MKNLQRLFQAVFTIFAFLVGCSPALAVSELQQPSGDLFTLHDRWGNTISISNRFDGSNYFVWLTQFNPNRGINWDRPHHDVYPERANAVNIDVNGHIYVAGVRSMPVGKVFWIMKYSSAGDLLWERVDVGTQDCAAFQILPNDAGDVWVAGSCISSGRYPIRLLRYDNTGFPLWGQSYDEGGRNYVRGLTIDYADRASVTVEVNSGLLGGGPPRIRTVVFDKAGSRVTAF
jgi:hypothetical protein